MLDDESVISAAVAPGALGSRFHALTDEQRASVEARTHEFVRSRADVVRGGGSDGCVFAKLLLLTGLHTPRASQLARTTLVGVRGLREGRQCATTVSPAALVYRAAPVAVLLRHRCRE